MTNNKLEYFIEMINLQFLSMERTFMAMDSFLGLHQKDEIHSGLGKIQKVIHELTGKLQKVKYTSEL
jgi:hypothetical protein